MTRRAQLVGGPLDGRETSTLATWGYFGPDRALGGQEADALHPHLYLRVSDDRYVYADDSHRWCSGCGGLHELEPAGERRRECSFCGSRLSGAAPAG